MRIATRLWLALVAAIVLVLGAGILVRVREEQRLLLEVTVLDRQFFGHALQAALAAESGGGNPLAEARAMLGRSEIANAHIQARLVSLNGAHELPPPTLSESETTLLAQGRVVVIDLGDDIVTFVPLEPHGALALELLEPQEHSFVLQRIAWWSLAMQSLALAALAAVVTLAVIRWLVGGPLEELAVLARRIAAGDLSARAIPGKRSDEVTTLAREMNTMAERLAQARDALEAADAERIAALEQLRHADRLRTVGQLASALAHELGTPLNVVSGHARLVEQEPSTAADARQSARTILEQTTRMTRLLRDLLDFARRRGRHREIVELAQLADHAAATLAPLARRTHVRIEVAEPDDAIRVTADAQQLLQVLTNLIVNAVQAMPEGGVVRIDVEVVDASAPTGVHAPTGRYARIRVSDDGTGIDAADLPHLFEPFFTRKEEGEGTGLGLAVVAGIVREHRGWVGVESGPGKGASFEVFLPAGED